MLVSKKLKLILTKEKYVLAHAYDVRTLQKALCDVEVDGIFGYHTTNSILRIPLAILLRNLYDIITNKTLITKGKDRKTKYLDYLGEYEGTTIHWNKTESAYTSPYGVYSKLFPKADVIKYINSLATKYNISLHKRNTKELARLNRSLTTSEKAQIRDLAWLFIESHFINKQVETKLSDKEALTFFSLSLNGGNSRGVKALQTALGGLVVDGYIGSKTFKALEQHKPLNKGMLAYMKRFYLRLIASKPWKYKRYKRGWLNRLKGLL